MTQPPKDARIENQPGAAGSRLARTTGSTSPVNRLLKWRSAHPEEAQKRKLYLSDPKYLSKRIATRQKNPITAKGVANALSLIWRLRDPCGRTYEIKNLAEFVRNNGHLFEPHEIRWTRRGNGIICLAYSGLESLRPYRRDGKLRRRVENVWHGWTWISGVEYMQTPPKRDLLDRSNEKGEPR